MYCGINSITLHYFKMAESVIPRKAYLLKERVKRLQFVGTPPSKSSDMTLLFTADVENFICIPDETYDVDQIKLIAREIEKATATGDSKPKIEMYGKFDTFFQTPRIYTVVLFPQEFVKALSSILPEPRICIKGTYKVIKQQFREWPRSTPHGPSQSIPVRSWFGPPQNPQPGCGPDLTSQPRSMITPRRIIANSMQQLLRNGHVIQRMLPLPAVNHLSSHMEQEQIQPNWTPVDDQKFDFSVEGIELKENATYEGFNGLEKLAEYYHSQGLRNVKLNYSIILEWKEYEKLSKGFEASTLEKLFEGKPLADCVIEASNGARFRCHRNILGVNSNVLLKMFEAGMVESQTRVVDMKDVNGEAVEMMLEYMYGRNLGLEGRSEEDILELLKLAHKYNISKLESAISQFLLYKSKDWFSMDGVLDFYFFVMNVDNLANLADKLKGVMKANTKGLSASGVYKEWMEKDAKAASQFVFKLFEREEGKINVEVEVGSKNQERSFIDVVNVDESSDDE